MIFEWAFFTVCCLVYAHESPAPRPVGVVGWARHLAVCVGAGWVLAALFTLMMYGFAAGGGIDPNAGQHM